MPYAGPALCRACVISGTRRPVPGARPSTSCRGAGRSLPRHPRQRRGSLPAPGVDPRITSAGAAGASMAIPRHDLAGLSLGQKPPISLNCSHPRDNPAQAFPTEPQYPAFIKVRRELLLENRYPTIAYRNRANFPLCPTNHQTLVGSHRDPGGGKHGTCPLRAFIDKWYRQHRARQPF